MRAPFLSSSVSEMEKWMEDLKMAVDLAEDSNGLSGSLLTNSNDVSKCRCHHIEFVCVIKQKEWRED